MSHPYGGKKSSDVAKKRVGHVLGRKDGGAASRGDIKKAVDAHDKQLHGGKHTDLSVIGEYARGGRARKGGKGKKGTQINIAIIGGGDKEKTVDAPMMPPPGAGLPPPPPMGGMPGAGGPPPGMPPKPPGVPGMMNRGGTVKMRGGAESGVGRLDKAKAQSK